MSADDILAALRQQRDEFARSYGYDLAAMAKALRELDRQAGARVVCRAPRPAGAPRPQHGRADAIREIAAAQRARGLPGRSAIEPDADDARQAEDAERAEALKPARHGQK